MATEQSQFSRLPKRQLVLIAEKLVDEDFPSDNPYGDYEYGKHYNNLESIGKYYKEGFRMSGDLDFKISKLQEKTETLRKFGLCPDDIGKVFADIIDAVAGLREEQDRIEKRIDNVKNFFTPIA